MASPRLVTLGDGVAEATVAPDLGGGLASYDLVGATGRAALFRPCRDLSRAGLFDLANNLLVPWSNRISGGGFHFRGRFHRLEPNVYGEPYPIHGSGFSSAWSVRNASAKMVELSLRSNGPAPFCYEARATCTLDAGALNMWRWVRNVGTETLPFGLGFHPWLVRTPDTLLQAKAKRVVLENSDHLPDGDAPVASRVGWDFAAPRALPADWINNAFLGWDGRATIIWADRDLALEVEGDGPLSTYIVYSPSARADFFCFEPLTHPVDAHNRPGGQWFDHSCAAGNRVCDLSVLPTASKLIWERSLGSASATRRGWRHPVSPNLSALRQTLSADHSPGPFAGLWRVVGW
jgi:aldose 1-epimerase